MATAKSHSILRRWLQLEDRYPSIKDFKLRVLDPAVAQINEHSPLAVTWEQRKTGRKVTHLTFTFGPKKPTKAAGKAPRPPLKSARVAS